LVNESFPEHYKYLKKKGDLRVTSPAGDGFKAILMRGMRGVCSQSSHSARFFEKPISFQILNLQSILV
jgi:hypothetical protein